MNITWIVYVANTAQSLKHFWKWANSFEWTKQNVCLMQNLKYTYCDYLVCQHDMWLVELYLITF